MQNSHIFSLSWQNNRFTSAKIIFLGSPLSLKIYLAKVASIYQIEPMIAESIDKRTFHTVKVIPHICILTAHNLWRHSGTLMHTHIENMADLP